jgi:hypothetical protein
VKPLISLLILVAIAAPLAGSAQRASSPPPGRPAPAAPARRTERPVPFKIGETLTYDISWSSYVTAGTAVMTVKEKRPSFNSTAYYIVAEGKPTPLVAKLYSLYYKLDTLLDSYTLLPQRGSVYQEEGSRHRFKVSKFDHAAHKVAFEYQAAGTATDTFTVPPYAQDVLSAVYVLRSIPFKPGDRMTMPVTDNGSNYKVQVDVAPTERLKVAASDVNAWKLRLGIFDASGKPQGRNVALWISDDAQHLPVKLQADLPVGSFNLNLREAR